MNIVSQNSTFCVKIYIILLATNAMLFLVFVEVVSCLDLLLKSYSLDILKLNDHSLSVVFHENGVP